MWKLSSLLFSLLLISACTATDPRAIYFNNKASKGIKERSIDESQNLYHHALEMEPFAPEIHNNLGSTYDVLKDYERAMRLYQNAEEYTEKNEPHSNSIESLIAGIIAGLGGNLHELIWNARERLNLFAALYNQGQLLGKEKKVDEALAKYQKALAYNSGSIEIKTNIELMLQNGQGQGQGESKDPNQNSQNEGDKNKDQNESEKESEQKKDYSSSPKYKPRNFEGDLNKENVQKIFSEISQQEKKMRAQFSKKNQSKDSPREKDW